MRSLSALPALILALILAVALLTPAPAAAQKFPNKDTAKNRQDNVFGTRHAGETIDIQDNATEGLAIDAVPQKKEERDWYENMVIGVQVNATQPNQAAPVKKVKVK